MHVGKIQPIGTGQICMYPLNVSQAWFFFRVPDISLEHKISHGRIFALYQGLTIKAGFGSFRLLLEF
jgi:hypothetical protein